MVGSADNQCVKVLRFFLEHDAIVMVAFGAAEALKDFGREIVIEVTQGDDVFTPALAQIDLAHAPDTNRGDSQLVARGLIAGAAKNKTRHDNRCRKTGSKHGASGYFICCIISRISWFMGFDFFFC